MVSHPTAQPLLTALEKNLLLLPALLLLCSSGMDTTAAGGGLFSQTLFLLPSLPGVYACLFAPALSAGGRWGVGSGVGMGPWP